MTPGPRMFAYCPAVIFHPTSPKLSRRSKRVDRIWIRCSTVLSDCGSSGWSRLRKLPSGRLSPKGTPPAVQLYSMAPRLDKLDGKTIYLVDATGFFGSDKLLEKMQVWFQQNMPSVKTVLRRKAGIYGADDPKLWAEIKANANATIMAIGH